MRHLATASVILALVLAAPRIVGAESPKDILIIVNKAATVGKTTVDELKDVFLKKRSSWSSGGKVIPVHAPEGSPLREDFRKRVLSMSASEEASHWQVRKIKAGDSKPAEFGDTLKAVFKLRGAVSYVYRSQYKEGTANVVLVLPAR
jgi:ABC-type phosphate transport system substrate-binding protein